MLGGWLLSVVIYLLQKVQLEQTGNLIASDVWSRTPQLVQQGISTCLHAAIHCNTILCLSDVHAGCEKAASKAVLEALPLVCGIDPAYWYPGLSAHAPWLGKSTAAEGG